MYLKSEYSFRYIKQGDREMPKPTRVMTKVCQQCFLGDWPAMLAFARQYDPNTRERDARFGKQFRDIIGTRNRSQFWDSVTKCGGSDSPRQVDGDSITGLQGAIKRLDHGETALISVNGRIVGKLSPFRQDDDQSSV
jgi:hypothetical protein